MPSDAPQAAVAAAAAEVAEAAVDAAQYAGDPQRHIYRTHQLRVEVLGARNLMLGGGSGGGGGGGGTGGGGSGSRALRAVFGGTCNPYVEVYVTGSRHVRRTGYVSNTRDAAWAAPSNTFLFDLPPRLATSRMGPPVHAAVVAHVLNHGTLRDVSLGCVVLPLRRLHDERDLVQWFPLRPQPRVGAGAVAPPGATAISKAGSASISGVLRMRVQNEGDRRRFVVVAFVVKRC